MNQNKLIKWTKEEVKEIMEKLNIKLENGNVNFLHYFVEYFTLENEKNYNQALNYARSQIAIDKHHL
jgi:hypothetical protein